MNECKSTHSSKLTKPSQVAAIGFIFASAIFVGLASEAQARIIWRYGDVRCHAAAAGPQYYYSRIESLSFGIDDPEGLLKLRNNTDEARRLERRTLDRLTGEFARYVAEYHEIDALTLLFPHCEVTKPGAAAAAARIEEATYFRDGAFVFYETSEKIAVDWVPDFSHAFAASSQAAVNAAADRKALAVGSSAYSHIGALSNPTNDAVAVGAALERLGFEVTTVLDASRGRLAQALRAFEMHSTEADIALVFYAGRGLEVGGSHYVVPVDARLERRADGPVETMNVARLFQAMAGAQTRIAIFDTCWFNPFGARTQSVGPEREAHRVGLQPVTSADGGLLVAYAAAAPGTCSEDGPSGGNSPYTQALLEQLEEPSVEVSVMFRRVGAAVLAATDGRQQPAVYSTLVSDLYLKLE